MPRGVFKHHLHQGFQKGNTWGKLRKGFKCSEATIEKIREVKLSKKGGRTKAGEGYILIYKPEHPFAIAGKRYVYEQRLVAEKQIGRYLTCKEVVHHINGNITNNQLENLIVFANNGYHLAFHRWGYYNPKHIIFDGRKINV